MSRLCRSKGRKGEEGYQETHSLLTSHLAARVKLLVMPEALWAPWRMEYISKADETNKGKDLFVDLPALEDDERALILHRGEHAFVVLNAYPYTSGHLMVAPYRKTTDLPGLSDAEHLEIAKLVARCTEWITRAYRPQGFNIGVNLGSAAGAGIPDHLHYHVVPRWSGDTNFMTAVGEVRVIPEDLAGTYRRLKAAMEEDDKVASASRR